MPLETFHLEPINPEKPELGEFVVMIAHPGDDRRVMGVLHPRARKCLIVADPLGQTPGMYASLLTIISCPPSDEQLTNAHNVPQEALLYWFTGCFYGRRQAAFRAAWNALVS